MNTVDELLADVALATLAKNVAYSERNKLVAALSKVFPACLLEHVEKEGEEWDPKWRFVTCITLPTGQVTWHIQENELPQFAHLKVDNSQAWDGHTTEEKYRRLAALETK